LFAFFSGRLASRNDSDFRFIPAVSVCHDKQAQLGAETEKNEPILISRVFRIMFDPGVLVGKSRYRLDERDAMLALVLSFFSIILGKRDLTHNAMIMRIACSCNRHVQSFFRAESG